MRQRLVPDYSPAHRIILLVENDENSCTALTKLLEGHGYIVRCAATVAEALAQLDCEPTHVIVDLMLPDGSGLSVLQYIRATAPWTKVAIPSGWVDPLLKGSVQPNLILKNNTELERLMGWLREAYDLKIGSAVG
jgi:CheY-like chemotaxis protein